jgi:parallel beta helix pectate lyase-like protein
MVTNTSDTGVPGDGSLRGEIAAAQSGDTINFNIPSSGMQTIKINDTLALTKQVKIDGTSQPGYNGTPLISVQGNASVGSLFSLGYGGGGSGSTIQGLDMYDFTRDAVGIAYGTNSNVIQNDWIGFFRDPTTGQVSLNYNLGGNFNNTDGIDVGSNNNVIRNNVIDGTNTGIGVHGFGGGIGIPVVFPAVNNSIVANFIGTNPSGTTAVGYGNQGDGIFLGQGSQSTQITGNVISGNTVNGIEMQLDDLHHRTAIPGYNLISGNKIGTDVSGNFAIPNGTGIFIFGAAANNTISDNLISGNLNVGISLGEAIYGIYGYGSYGPGNSNWIQGNIIGLNASQTAVISPGNYGISFSHGSTGNHVQGNVIAGAKLAGILSDTNTSGNYINQNWIGESANGQSFPNGYYGVELLSGSWYNSVMNNSFGPNGVGSVYVGPNTNWNSISYTPQPTPSSLLAQVQIMVDYYLLMVQELALNNPSGFFGALQDYMYFAGIVQTEIFNSLLRM